MHSLMKNNLNRVQTRKHFFLLFSLLLIHSNIWICTLHIQFWYKSTKISGSFGIMARARHSHVYMHEFSNAPYLILLFRLKVELERFKACKIFPYIVNTYELIPGYPLLAYFSLFVPMDLCFCSSSCISI